MADASDWQRLADLLDEDPGVWAAVRDALDAGEDPWEALLDGLDDAGALAYLQSDDTGMELAEALAQLPLVVRAAPDLDQVNDTDDLTEATALADGVLLSASLRLIRLVEEGEDSWPMVVVDEEAAPEVLVLASRVGHEAIVGG